jgi:hypothetical protein
VPERPPPPPTGLEPLARRLGSSVSVLPALFASLAQAAVPAVARVE